MFIFVALILLSYLPNLLSTINTPFYRTGIALTPLMVILLLWAILQWMTLVPKNFQQFTIHIILIISTIFGIYHARKTMLEARLLPSMLEVTYIKNALRNSDLTQYDSICIMRSNRTLGNLPPRVDEFSMLSTNCADDYLMVKCLLREIGFHAEFGKENGLIKYALNEQQALNNDFHYLSVIVLQLQNSINSEATGESKTFIIDMDEMYNHAHR
jgi:hypothetical protein